MENQIEKKDNHRDLFIDFLKGIAILGVVFAHSLPHVIYKWSLFLIYGGMAVPIFLLIQAYHIYNKNDFKSIKDLKLQKVWKRIFFPFIIVILFSGSLLVIRGHDPLDILNNIFTSGGIGPGSYYVWIYLQFMILIPICLTIFNKIGGGYFNIYNFCYY